MKEIELSEKRILAQNEIPHSFLQEDKNKIKAAIFYSIFSTQRGLQVINMKKQILSAFSIFSILSQ